MVIYWGQCLQMFFEPLSKCSWGLSNVFLITFHPVTFVSLSDFTFLLDGILIFWSHQEILDSIASFKVDLHSMFTACFLYAFTDYFIIRNHHMWFLDVVTRVLDTSAVLVSSVFSFDSNPCSAHMQDICILWVLVLNVLPLAVTAQGWNRWFELCDEVYLLQYT